jgi:Zn-finger nucleic acid-binding protein
MTCPQCQGTMTERTFGHVTAHRCADCGGVFLARADLGALVEAETDWHAHQSANTAQLPRITADMAAPVTPQRTRAYVETLFNG